MNAAKDVVGHTPGMWAAAVHVTDHGGWKNPEQFVTISSENNIIAHYSTDSSEYPSESECEANAFVLASAPGLLLALSWLLGLHDEQPKDYDEQLPLALAAARCAIAKARPVAASDTPIGDDDEPTSGEK